MDFEVSQPPASTPPGEPNTNPKTKGQKKAKPAQPGRSAQSDPVEAPDDEPLSLDQIAHERRKAEHVPVLQASAKDQEATWAAQDKARKGIVLQRLATLHPEVRELLEENEALKAKLAQ
jgi:hypothetical protein